MIRALLVAALLLGHAVDLAVDENPRAEQPSAQLAQTAEESKRDCIPREECCKVCTKGKACGNSCISASSTCHKGRGCSCDAHEVCQ